MNFGILKRLTSQISLHANAPGKMWLLLNVIFYAVANLTFGKSLFGSEKTLTCLKKKMGCMDACWDGIVHYNHYLFWTFRLVIVFLPMVLFHMHVMFVEGQIKLISAAKGKMEATQTVMDATIMDSPECDRTTGVIQCEQKIQGLDKKMKRKEATIGKYRIRHVPEGGKFYQVVTSDRLKSTYIFFLLVRFIAEMYAMYAYYNIYAYERSNYELPKLDRNEAPPVLESLPRPYEFPMSGAGFDLGVYLSMSTSSVITCDYRMNRNLFKWCTKVITNMDCYISQPQEKTIFIRYMNTVALISAIGTILELLHYSYRFIKEKRAQAITVKKVKKNIPMEMKNLSVRAESIRSINRSKMSRMNEYPDELKNGGAQSRLNNATVAESHFSAIDVGPELHEPEPVMYDSIMTESVMSENNGMAHSTLNRTEQLELQQQKKKLQQLEKKLQQRLDNPSTYTIGGSVMGEKKEEVKKRGRSSSRK